MKKYCVCIYYNKIINLILVRDCKALYRKIRDAARYQRKKTTGKSGDSGDEGCDDEPNNSRGSAIDDYPFLSPTSSKHPRKTATYGGSSSVKPLQSDSESAKLSTAEYNQYDDYSRPPWLDDEETSGSVYSYVSIFIQIYLCLKKANFSL